VIYLDHAATSPLLPEVRDAMLPWLGVPANPASVHRAGREAAAALERAREQVACLLGRPAQGVVFVSGATEGNHTALRGFAARGARRFAVAPIEHPSVLGALEQAQAEIVALPVSRSGVVLLEDLSPVDVIVLQSVNHELGAIQPVARASELAAQRGSLLHVDATQAAGKLELQGDPDTLVISGHKLGGPAGIGALSLREPGPFPALLTGGAQERRRRAGTVNVAGAVGMGVAAMLAHREREQRTQRWTELAEHLRAGLVPMGARLVGTMLPSTTTFVLPLIRGDLLVQALDLRGIAVSSGAACASGSVEPSPVLRAIGDPEPSGGVRVSFGRQTTRADVEALLHALSEALPAIRQALCWEP
jgi:cysteine desulfurase